MHWPKNSSRNDVKWAKCIKPAGGAPKIVTVPAAMTKNAEGLLNVILIANYAILPARIITPAPPIAL